MTLSDLQVPNEYRFVQALALAVDGADCLDVLRSVGAVGEEELAIVAGVRKALEALGHRPMKEAYAVLALRKVLVAADNRAYLAYRSMKEAYAVLALREALVAADNRAYLAYRLVWSGCTAEALIDGLARIGVAWEYATRPWADGLWGWLVDLWRFWITRVLAQAGLASLGLRELDWLEQERGSGWWVGAQTVEGGLV